MYNDEEEGICTQCQGRIVNGVCRCDPEDEDEDDE